MTRSTAPGLFDVAQILASVGEVAYEWHIDTDVLRWSPNVENVLLVRSAELVATGHDYTQLLEAENAQARTEAVMHSEKRDDGHGAPYQINTASGPILLRKPNFGWRTPVAGLPVAMAVRCAPTGSSASSTSAMNTSAGLTLLLTMTGSPANRTGTILRKFSKTHWRMRYASVRRAGSSS